jgi:ankyrin repeat protein
VACASQTPLKLAARDGADVEALNEQGLTPLMVAVYSGDLELL